MPWTIYSPRGALDFFSNWSALSNCCPGGLSVCHHVDLHQWRWRNHYLEASYLYKNSNSKTAVISYNIMILKIISQYTLNIRYFERLGSKVTTTSKTGTALRLLRGVLALNLNSI